MSTTETATNPVTPPAAPAPDAATSTAVPAQTIAPKDDDTGGDPNQPGWMDKRLERDRRKLYKDITGEKVPKDKTVAEFVAEKKAADAAAKAGKKAEREADKKKLAELEAALATSTETKAAIRVYAEAELSKLTDRQREAVKAAAGDSPAEQLKTISAWRIAGLLVDAPAQQAATTQQTTVKPAQQLANTAPATAPAPATTTTEMPLKERWKSVIAIPDKTQREAAKLRFVAEYGDSILYE